MKLRDCSLRRWLLVGALVLALPLVAMRLQLRWQLNRELDQLRADGVPLSLQEFAETYRASAEAIQAGAVLTNIYWRLPLPTEEEEPHIRGIGGNRDLRPGEAMPETVRQVTSNYLSRVAGLLPELYAALERPEVRYDRDFNKWDALDGYESGLTRNAVKILQTEFLYALDQAEWQRAAQAAVAQLRVAQTLQAEPGWLGHMNQRWQLLVATTSLELLLEKTQPDLSSIETLRQAIKPHLDHRTVAHAVAGERAMFLEITLPGKGTAIEADDDQSFNLEGILERMVALLHRMSGMADQDIVFYIRLSRQCEPALSGSLQEQHELAANWSKYLPPRRVLPYYFLSRSAWESVGKIVEHHVARQSKLLAADAALAVAQYRLQYDGKVPASLDELVPEFLEAVPIEPQSGQPFELIVTPDGYGIGRGTPVFNVKPPQP